MRRRPLIRPVAAGLVAVLVGTGCTGGGSPSRSADDAVPASAKAAPRWERVVSLAGTGSQRTENFRIAPGAIQWRVTATCRTGRLRVGLDGEPSALVEPSCPGRGFGFSVTPGAAALDVAATGEWTAVVDQQVDTPLSEAALPGMTAATRLAEGRFSGIDQKGSGTAAVYRLPGGGLALRLEPFLVTANSDLFVWTSEAKAPTTSKEAFESPHVQVAALKATAGAQNYRLPPGLTAERIASVVVWCEPVRTAYAAAPLVRR